MNLETQISERIAGGYKRDLPLHVYPKGRKGYLYFVRRGACLRLEHEVGTPEFDAEYASAVEKFGKRKPRPVAAKSHSYDFNAIEIPPAHLLHELLKYEPDGRLIWRERLPHHFKESVRVTQESCASRWNGRLVGKRADRPTTDGRYRYVLIMARRYLAHRVIWMMIYGEQPQTIDHINGDGLDNRVSNLRSVTLAENAKNQRVPKLNTSGHLGVSRHKGKWKVQIAKKFLGLYDTLEEAVAAQREGLRQLGFHENHGRR